ncbi:MAG: efflux RND transporter periplasmic adaptor subunit [Planctomycetes bacterium]|nr:efflux RND transporter periplasmic adaptor subunit [Planctomycetota bacterium]
MPTPPAVEELLARVQDNPDLARWTTEMAARRAAVTLARANAVPDITPRVPGVVRQVDKGLGDAVRAGDLLAVLDSRELAEARAGFLAASERLELAGSILAREKYLHERQITSEQEYLQARQAEAEAWISLRSADQRLAALGLAPDEIQGLKDQPDQVLTRYEMRAPFDGVIVEKHITLGEMIGDESLPFVIADLSDVWIVLVVYQKDLASIAPGQRAEIVATHDLAESVGRIEYVSPILDEHTRTTTARVVLRNGGEWRPGLFVTARVVVDRVHAGVVVPKTAIQTIDGEQVVFVETSDGFEARHVRSGRSDAGSVEILAGLEPGDRYVARGGFALKAQLGKASFQHAGHGH